MLNLSLCFHSVLAGIVGMPASGEAPAERGVALGLFASDSNYDYRMLLEEIQPQTHATHLSLVWVWWQKNVSANEIKPVSGWTATDQQILASMKKAKELGFAVTAFPIVRLINAEANEWRGKIAPQNEDLWWDSYFDFIAHAANLASAAGVERLTIGSELVSREPMRARWLRVVERLRLRHPQLQLMYSANWDHYQPVSFWDAVDHIGITGYWEIGKHKAKSEKDLVRAWGPIIDELQAWSDAIKRPLIITEIGYPSIDGGLRWPWNETRSAPVNLEEQVLGYRAFVNAFSGKKFLAGVYWWNWFGFGGSKDRDYTPRNKPASKVIADWYRVSAD